MMEWLNPHLTPLFSCKHDCVQIKHPMFSKFVHVSRSQKSLNLMKELDFCSANKGMRHQTLQLWWHSVCNLLRHTSTQRNNTCQHLLLLYIWSRATYVKQHSESTPSLIVKTSFQGLLALTLNLAVLNELQCLGKQWNDAVLINCRCYRGRKKGITCFCCWKEMNIFHFFVV